MLLLGPPVRVKLLSDLVPQLRCSREQRERHPRKQQTSSSSSSSERRRMRGRPMAGGTAAVAAASHSGSA